MVNTPNFKIQLTAPSGESILIGGVTSEYYSTQRTYSSESVSSKSWDEGPDMSMDRYEFGCSLVTIGMHFLLLENGLLSLFMSLFFSGEALYAAVAGGYSTKQGSQASVEFMDLSKTNNEREWIKGPALPWELMEFSMITTSSGDGLLAVGGISGNNALYST